MHSDHTPKISLPCPDWCTQPDGHAFDSFEADQLFRFHEHEVEAEGLTPGGVDGGRIHEVGVLLEQLEVGAVDEDRVIRRDSIFLAFAGYREGTELNAAQARRLAGALLNAADEWDRASGVTS